MSKNCNFIEKLRELGLRPTKQRAKMCDVLFNREKTFHFTINDLVKIISEEISEKISLATVREGQDIPIGETVFESSTVITASIFQTPKPGQYVIRYVVTAQDGDMNDGGYAFELYEKQDSSKTWSYLAASLGILLVVVLLLRAKPKAQRKEESGD